MIARVSTITSLSDKVLYAVDARQRPNRRAARSWPTTSAGDRGRRGASSPRQHPRLTLVGPESPTARLWCSTRQAARRWRCGPASGPRIEAAVWKNVVQAHYTADAAAD